MMMKMTRVNPGKKRKKRTRKKGKDLPQMIQMKKIRKKYQMEKKIQTKINRKILY